VACSVTVTSWSVSGADFLTISSSGLITGTPAAGDAGSHAVSVMAVTAGGTVWQNYTLEVERQSYTDADGLFIAFGLMGFAMVLSALVSVVAVARRHN
jgi:hypothetical protein